LKYQDYINRYRILLLEIIPDFFNEDDILNFNFKSPDERKRYFTDLKFSTDPGYYTKEYLHHYYSDKKKSELREPYIKQQKEWIKKCSAFVKQMQDVLHYIDHPDLPQFRFKFFNKCDKHLENDLKDKTEVSIFVCFMSYLFKSKNEQKSFSTAETIIRDKMIVQEDEYIQKNKNRIRNVLVRKTKMKRAIRIPDKEFKQLCKEVERECSRVLAGDKTYFKEVSRKSKDNKYDKTEKGYTPLTAKKRYYKVFPSKKANQ